MRISMCEFLRVTTHRNWCYVDKNYWVSDRAELWAEVDNGNIIVRRKATGRMFKTLEYFEGVTARNVRSDIKGYLK